MRTIEEITTRYEAALLQVRILQQAALTEKQDFTPQGRLRVEARRRTISENQGLIVGLAWVLGR